MCDQHYIASLSQFVAKYTEAEIYSDTSTHNPLELLCTKARLEGSSRAKQLLMFGCCGANLTLLILTQFQRLNCALGTGDRNVIHSVSLQKKKDVNHHVFSSHCLHSCIPTVHHSEWGLNLNWFPIYKVVPVGFSHSLRDDNFLFFFKAVTYHTLVNWNTNPQISFSCFVFFF